MKRLSVFEGYLILIIILNILDFFEWLPGELDYAKKIISWTMLGLMLFHASPSHLFFGPRTKWFDISFIFACFILIIKDLVGYAVAVIDEASVYVLPFFEFLIRYANTIDRWSIIIGIVSLGGIAIVASAKIEFQKKSILGVIGESGEHQHKFFLLHILSSFIVFLTFFLFVFNLVMEWLAIAVDSTILLAALFFYSFFFVKHRIGLESLVDKVGEIGGSFYEKFLDHFRYKESLLLGIVGLLVLHLLTDVGIFLVPYITGIHDPLYFSSFGPGHDHAWAVLFSDLATLNLADAIATSFIFIANIIAYLFLFISPAIMWNLMYHGKQTILNKKLLALFFISLPAAILNPLFAISSFNGENLVGVDVTTQSLLSFPPLITLAISIILFVVVRGAVHHKASKRFLEHTWVGISTVFFGAYTWFFFSDIFTYYQEVVDAFSKTNMFVAVVFFLFEILSIFFYAGGFVLFLYELGKHHRKPQSLEERREQKVY